MKLVRAACECGFYSQKARQGYNFHQWWFPILNLQTGQLQDVLLSLPEDQVDQIQWSKVTARELHVPFLESATCELTEFYDRQEDLYFNPNSGNCFHCPQCSEQTLQLVSVPVTAICKKDCGHEYPWHDTEEHGCPRCNYRPHGFLTDIEKYFATLPRTISNCPCSSSMESAGHDDAYCPKCGRLPISYSTHGQSFCGKHHLELLPYKLPGNFLFMLPMALEDTLQFPQAKFYGDAETDDFIDSSYCPVCEADYQAWLVLNEIDE